MFRHVPVRFLAMLLIMAGSAHAQAVGIQIRAQITRADLTQVQMCTRWPIGGSIRRR
jgi:hypothetical protein